MTGAQIFQLLVIFGPDAIGLIEEIAANWNKEIPPDRVQTICSASRKSISDYSREARARLIALGQLPSEPTV